MEDNIFKNAKFGDKFLTRNGSLALFIKWDNGHPVLIDETFRSLVKVHQDGWFWKKHEQETPSDIISRYKELIDEDELEELAYESYNGGYSSMESYIRGYKAGYSKAKDE